MTVEYVSWKQGDPAIKADPQTVKPNTWTLLKFGKNGDVIVPQHDGVAEWAVYVNIANNGGASDVKIRFIRDPKKLADYTGMISFPAGQEPQSHTWFFKATRKQPVGVQIYHNGKKDMVISTREFKMWIP